MKQKILSNDAPKPIGPYSQAIKNENMLFISGQIGIDNITNEITQLGIEKETKLVMENITSIIEKAGYSINDIVKCTIFLSNMTMFSYVNEVYAQYFTQPYPARETVEVSALPKNANVEISAIAIKK